MNEVSAHLALLVWIVGFVIYVICSAVEHYGDAKEIGRLMFAIGLLAWLLGH